jgi:uroporphyrinogen decarboxylase
MTTQRERWRAVLRGEIPDRPATDYWATTETTARLMRDLGCPTERRLWETLGVDKCIRLAPIYRPTGEDDWHTPSQWRAWRIGTTKVKYGDGLGEYEETALHPLAGATSAAEVERFDWPDPEAWEIGHLREHCDEWDDWPKAAGCYEPFYLYCHLRGMEQALQDLVENPAIAEAALERIYLIHERLIRRVLDAVGSRIDFVYVAEDLGTQDSLLMSPAAFRRFLKPRMARIIDLVHSYGVKAFHHDDGACRPLIPDLIEIGIDVLNPIQWRCRGMDREGLARDFGSQLVFHGGVDNQRTLPFGTPEDVRREVLDNLRIFRKCRGYVVAPCHNMQANTPTANVIAMYQAAGCADAF